MTAQVFAQFDLEDREISGDAFASVFADTPGTLWERVADSQPGIYARVLDRPHYGEPESIPQRVERIAYDHNISRREALHVALAESRLERAKAAHPAGKGRQRATDE